MRSLVTFMIALAMDAAVVLAADQGPPMQVRLIRAGGDCDAVCPEWIAAQGRIDPTTPAQFKVVLDKLGPRRLPIVVDSPGGSVQAAMEIARTIRKKGFDVVVGKTTILKCDPILEECRTIQNAGFALGSIAPRKAWCASACAILIAGGTRRFVGPEARVGIHAMTTYADQSEREWIIEEPDPTADDGKKQLKAKGFETKGVGQPAPAWRYETVRKFYREMTISETIVDLMMKVPASQIRTMTKEQLATTGLATNDLGPFEILFGAARRQHIPATPYGAASTPLYRR